MQQPSTNTDEGAVSLPLVVLCKDGKAYTARVQRLPTERLPGEADVAQASAFGASVLRATDLARAASVAAATARQTAEAANRESRERLQSEQRRLDSLLDAGQRRLGSATASTAAASAATRESLEELDAGHGREEPFLNPDTLAYLRRLLGALLTRENVGPALLALILLMARYQQAARRRLRR